MLKVTVTCTECHSHEIVDGVSRPVPMIVVCQTFASYKECVLGLQGLLISSHAKSTHVTHQLAFKIEGEEASSEPKTLEIQCASVACRADTKSWSGKVPIELVGAMTIMFHTGHEGHPLRIIWDGEAWETPR